ncbi:hypothetical protein ACFWBC_37655 [Streptomyces sp. NPDC059985]|uniref:hypothetical protein n=1 Tax=Streptomyces sp. NPDC059985 TaxID=3347025 RepID=UPI00367C6BBA
MTVTTPNVPNRPGPALARAPVPAGETLSGRGRVRMSAWLWRRLLAPRTTPQARRLSADFGPGMDARTAWVMARLTRHPDAHVPTRLHLDGEKRSS